ncbi:hypothetical protein AAW12_07680 [Sphingobacterium sp. Ag1]|nr:hypothetical protein AAW12_07680 [Sphingobacterium sp. Ag1]
MTAERFDNFHFIFSDVSDRSFQTSTRVGDTKRDPGTDHNRAKKSFEIKGQKRYYMYNNVEISILLTIRIRKFMTIQFGKF